MMSFNLEKSFRKWGQIITSTLQEVKLRPRELGDLPKIY